MITIKVSPEFKPIWDAEGGFEGMWEIQGELYRHVAARRTVQFIRNGKSFFVKIHGGVGWREIFKNLLTLRLPIVGATSEFRAIDHLRNAGLATPQIAAFAQKGFNPASLRSLIVTDDLGESISLEDICGHWPTSPPDFRGKLKLIEEVADIARRMHASGINHRDFYLCHFLRRAADGQLYLIDLHRAQLRSSVPRRWLIKDLGGLYYSSMDIGLTQRDLLRFIRAYKGQRASQVLRVEKRFWIAVGRRARQLYKSGNRG